MQDPHLTPPGDTPAASTTWGPDRALLVAAIAVAVVALGYLLYPLIPTSEPGPTAAPQSQPAQPGATGTAQASGTAVWKLQSQVPTASASPTSPAQAESLPGSDPTKDLSHYVPRGAKPTMPEVIQRLQEAGIHTGLGAFNPPGTRPPMVGLAVPEEFPLPTGYVRHYQATDDGQRIEPILMFAPDFQLLDAQKRPVDMPKNRVVPAELAPPGLPVRLITIPAPLAAPQ